MNIVRHEKEIAELMPLVKAMIDSNYADSTVWAVTDRVHIYHLKHPKLTQKDLAKIMDEVWFRLLAIETN